MAGDEDRKIAVYYAHLAMKTKRYRDAVETLKNVSQLNVKLTEDEMDLIDEAYKNLIGSKKAAINVLLSVKQTEGNEANVLNIDNYIKKIELEMTTVNCFLYDVIASSTIIVNKSFYWKIIGDNYRVCVEYKHADEREEMVSLSRSAYQSAWDLVRRLDYSSSIHERVEAGFNLLPEYTKYLHKVFKSGRVKHRKYLCIPPDKRVFKIHDSAHHQLISDANDENAGNAATAEDEETNAAETNIENAATAEDEETNAAVEKSTCSR